MKIGFLSLGCPKNLVDGEVMLGLAREAGHEITADSSDAVTGGPYGDGARFEPVANGIGDSSPGSGGP